MSAPEAWVRPDEAAVWLGVSVGHARVLAHRDGWRRRVERGVVRYSLADVDDTKVRREAGRG